MPAARHAAEHPVAGLFRRYAKLRAWGRDLSLCRRTFRNGSSRWTSGHAYWPDNSAARYPAVCRIVVTFGADLADAHATLLHELAHVSAAPDHHGLRWRHAFLAAGEEVTGRRIVPATPDRLAVHAAVREAFAAVLAAEAAP